MTRLIIKLWHDDMPDDPCDYGWKVHSFSKRHSNWSDPFALGLDSDGHIEPELREKLDKGLAFFLSYYEHGQCLWSLQNELPAGAQCPWDSVGTAGLLIWEENESDLNDSLEDRTADARAFIERYTMWCNGEVYGYTVDAVKDCPSCGQEEDVDLPDLPSCGGYYANDIEGMVIDMKDQIPDWRDYEVRFEEQHGYGLADEVESLWRQGEEVEA